MRVNNISLYELNNTGVQKNSGALFQLQNADIVSFSAKKEEKKASIPYRLESKMQDAFHVTGEQIRMRRYLEFRNQGLSDEEVAEKMFPLTFENANPEEVEEVTNYTKKLHKKVDDIDASFKKVIPSLFPKTYYRGVVGDNENRAIREINNAEIGDVIVPDLGYPFMASKLEYTEGYSQYVGGTATPDTCAVMIIKTPAGTPISRDITFESILGERNAVLARGAKFEVQKKEIKNNKTYITLKYLSCATDEEK